MQLLHWFLQIYVPGLAVGAIVTVLAAIVILIFGGHPDKLGALAIVLVVGCVATVLWPICAISIAVSIGSSARRRWAS